MKLIIVIINYAAGAVVQNLSKRGFMPVMPVEPAVGGATLFGVDVERFERL